MDKHIETLKQMRDDTKTAIVRHYAKLEAVDNIDETSHRLNALEEAIELAEASRWRMVETDGLPQEDGNYWVAHQYWDAKPETQMATYRKGDDDFEDPTDDFNFFWPSSRKVIAWMPLPKYTEQPNE